MFEMFGNVIAQLNSGCWNVARWDQGSTSTTIPDWFWQAVETEREEGAVEVDECDVCFSRWGDRSKPDILLIHGMNAHRRWWDFIAPQISQDYHVVAMDLTGMGDSDYRYAYDSETYAQEIRGVCDAADLDDNVVIVGHSFGGMMATKAVHLYPDRFGALILVDSGIRHPDEPIKENRVLMGGGRAKAYPDRASAEQRFRLFPPQPCENAYILQYIAKQSLMRVDGGWAWKFDEELPMVLKGGERFAEDYSGLSIPIGIIYGKQSESFTERTLEYMLELIPGDVACSRSVSAASSFSWISSLVPVISRSSSRVPS